MDLATVVGIVSAFAIILSAMSLGGGIGMFIETASILIVVGGTFGVVMSKFTLGQFLGAVKIAVKAFSFKTIEIDDLINKVVELSDLARKNGLLALEGQDTGHPFLQKGIQLLVDGHEADTIKVMMKKDMMQTLERHKTGKNIFIKIADTAPAMGMIGTLVGLVQMLANMSDPASIGPAMAVALLTTLYGAIIANMIASPIADKLDLRAKEEYLIQSLVIDALSGIQSGQNPRVLAEVLKNYLMASMRNQEAK